MITIHKSQSEMMALIGEWYDQNRSLPFMGWEDQEAMEALLQQQFTIDWDLAQSTLPEHNYERRPVNLAIEYARDNARQFESYSDLKRFITEAGSQQNNRRRVALRQQWYQEWFPDVATAEQQIQGIQRVACSVYDLLPARERYRSDQRQAFHILQTA